ncbi:phenoloxidase-activating factor 3-like [Chironomus tepperi]|uniref:phenoloxidase-activating factor 3-like n=1 Tax=Chironomus tepperi TaxID=113505 RepID=UPI00391F3148
MCFNYSRNLVFGIIISVLLVILGILLVLIFIQPSSLKRPQCKLDKNSFGVCVKTSDCISDNMYFNEDECGSSDGFMCCSFGDVIPENEKKFIKHKNYKFLSTSRCGLNNESQISSNNNTDGVFSYLVDLGKETESGEVNFTCSGSLINEFFVLTTVKCVLPLESGFNLSMIRLRHKEGCENNDCETISDFKIIPHQEFDPENLTNDIALVKLAQPLDLQNYAITPICLPFGIEKVPNIMNAVNSNLMSHFISLPEFYSTLKNFNRLNNSSKVKLKPLYEDNQFCAQARGVNINCSDTLGSSLEASSIIRGQNRIVQYGILSDKLQFCELPQIYTKINNYLIWILDNVDS